MKKTIWLITLISVMLPASVSATDGYFMLGHGTISRGIGGAGAAYFKTSIIGNNPAGNVFLGRQYCASANVFQLDRKYTVIGNPSGAQGTMPLVPGTTKSDDDYVFVPSIGANWVINEKSTFGIYINGSGLSTNYPTNTYHDPTIGTTGLAFLQLFANPTYSIKINDKHSFGVTATLGYQEFKLEGLAAFGPNSVDAANLTNKGTEAVMGAGFKIGYMGEIAEGLHLGAYYQSKIFMSKYEDYKGFFPEGGKIDVPANWTIGLNYKINDQFRALFDVQHIRYNDVKALGSPFSNLDVVNNVKIGSDNGPGFGWDNMTVFKFGTEFTLNDNWTFRGGFAFGNQPIQDTDVLLNILAPVVNEKHLTFGVSKAVGDKGKAINFAVIHAFENKIKGPNPLDTVQDIELSISQLEFDLSFTF